MCVGTVGTGLFQHIGTDGSGAPTAPGDPLGEETPGGGRRVWKEGVDSDRPDRAHLGGFLRDLGLGTSPVPGSEHVIEKGVNVNICQSHGALGIQVPSQKVIGPSTPT